MIHCSLPPGTYSHSAPTSIDAAREMRNTAATLRRQVLVALVEAGHRGMTDDEMQRELSMQGSTQRPRRIELQAAGLVGDLGERRPTASGRAAVVWHATGKGRLAMGEVP
jgi:hypothetical protein